MIKASNPSQARWFRFILQGQGVEGDGDWFGFYAAREARDTSEIDASNKVIGALETDWATGESAHVGRIEKLQIIAGWQARRFLGRRMANGGHTLFGDDIDAQRAALRLELKVAAAPWSIRSELQRELR